MPASLKQDCILKALTLFKSKYPKLKFNKADYDIRVWKQNHLFKVQFERKVVFLSIGKKNENYDSDFEVFLADEQISPLDWFGVDRFYTPTKEEELKTEFVCRCLNLPVDTFKHIIEEQEDKYCIYMDNEVAFARYFIDKQTGEEVMSPIQGSYNTSPDFKVVPDSNDWVEVFE